MASPPMHSGLIPDYLATTFSQNAVLHETFTLLLNEVKQLTSKLRTHDIGKGSLVVTLHPANKDWITLDAAILRCGAIHIPFHQPHELNHAVEYFNDFIILVHPSFKNEDILIGKTFHCIQSTEDVLMKDQLQQMPDADAAEVSPSDIAMIIFTCNSNSEVKPYAISHQNLISTAVQAGKELPLEPGEVYLSLLPFSKIYGRVCLMTFQLRGCLIECAENLLLPSRLIKASGAASVALVPSLLQYPVKVDAELQSYIKERTLTPLANVPKEALKAVFGNKIKLLICGGSMLSEDLISKFENSPVSLMEGYGLTQTTGVFTLNTHSAHRSGSKGKPLEGMHVRISDDGEILAKGIGICPGLVLPDGSLQAVTDDEGWFHTGDEGFLDADGFLFITGNRKRVFKLANGYYYDPKPDEKSISEELRAASMICRDVKGDIHLLLEKSEFSDLEKLFLKNFKIHDFSFPLSSVCSVTNLPPKRPYTFSPPANALIFGKRN